MKIGYIRISKHEQNEALQRDALREAQCEKYFSDTVTGAKFERKGLEKLLAFMRTGDTIVVWKLDRLGRSLKDLIETLHLFQERGVDFISLTEQIDTTTPGGKLIFHLMGALAEFERDLIRVGKLLWLDISIKSPSTLLLKFAQCLRFLVLHSFATSGEPGKYQGLKRSGKKSGPLHNLLPLSGIYRGNYVGTPLWERAEQRRQPWCLAVEEALFSAHFAQIATRGASLQSDETF
jgi:Resolvase, N terminal domain